MSDGMLMLGKWGRLSGGRMRGWVIASAGPSLIDSSEFERCDLSGLHPDTTVHSCIFRDCRLPSAKLRLDDCLTEVSE